MFLSESAQLFFITISPLPNVLQRTFVAQKHLFLQHAKLPRRPLIRFSMPSRALGACSCHIQFECPCFLPEPTSPPVWHLCVFHSKPGVPFGGV